MKLVFENVGRNKVTFEREYPRTVPLAEVFSEWLDRQLKAHVLSRDIDYQDSLDGKGIDIYVGWHCVGHVRVKDGSEVKA